MRRMIQIEMNTFLESIGGLDNGFYPDRNPIKDSGFFECGNGWYPLIKDLITDLIELGWDKQVCQVKEKFGTLRFYIQAGTDEHYNYISFAESMSGVTCETCGKPGKRLGRGWIYTACEEHAEDDDWAESLKVDDNEE